MIGRRGFLMATAVVPFAGTGTAAAAVPASQGLHPFALRDVALGKGISRTSGR
jgi:hypothetical protein